MSTIKCIIFLFTFLGFLLAECIGQTGMETFYLKDGTKIQGKIIAQDENKILLETRYGSLEIQRENILKREPSSQDTSGSLQHKAQIIRLVDGSTIKGIIRSETADSLKVETAYGIMSIPQSQVRRLGTRAVSEVEHGVQAEPQIASPPAVERLQERTLDKYPTGKDSRMISGLASYSVTKVKDVDEALTNLTLAPNYVYFVNSGLGLGVDLSLGWQSYGEESTTTLAFGPKFLIAFGKPESRSFPYIGFGIDYLTISNTYETYDWNHYYEKTTKTETASGNVIKIGAGVLTMINRNLALPVELGIVITNVESEKMTVYSIGIGLAGFLY